MLGFVMCLSKIQLKSTLKQKYLNGGGGGVLLRVKSKPEVPVWKLHVLQPCISIAMDIVPLK